MFNPQRKSKVADIFMQQKMYKLHLSKMANISSTTPNVNNRYSHDEQQEQYLKRISLSKQEVKDRLENQIKRENCRLMSKLVDTDNRAQTNPQKGKSKRKHHNSYFSSKKETQRIHDDNFSLVMRMDRMSSEIPTLSQLKKQYKQSRKFAKNCRKLPSIVKHEQEYKRKLSQQYMLSARSSRTQKQ